MSVGISTRTHTFVNVTTRSYNYTANTLSEFLIRITAKRELSPEYLVRHAKVLDDGFRTWLMGRWLESLRLEVYDPQLGKAVEVYVFNLSYTPVAGGSESFDSQVKQVEAKLAELPPLPAGLTYRVIANTGDGAPPVPGWKPTPPLPTDHLESSAAGQVIGSAACNVDLDFFTERKGGNGPA